jgi:hypothetical protein
MINHRNGTVMRSILGALVALLGVLAFAPASARAGCNAHVRTAGLHRTLGIDSFADPAVGTAHAGPRTPARGDAPACSGPSCSEGSRAPLAPTPASSTRHHRLWCDTAAAPPEPGLPAAAARPEGPSLYRFLRRTDVDRPPRPRPA